MAKKKKKPSDDDVKPSKKNRGRTDDDEDEDDDLGDEIDDDPDRPRNNVYVGLGAITLVALLTSAVFLYLDHDANNKKQPPAVSVAVGDLKLK